MSTFNEYIQLGMQYVSTPKMVVSGPIAFIVFFILLYCNAFEARRANRVFKDWVSIISDLPRAPTNMVEMSFITLTLDGLSPYLRKLQRGFRMELLFLVITLVTGLYTVSIISALTLVYITHISSKVVMTCKVVSQLHDAVLRVDPEAHHVKY